MAMKTPEEYRQELERKRGLRYTKRRIEAEVAAYREEYLAEKKKEEEQYMNSDLVKTAGKIISDFFYQEVLRKEPHNSTQEEINCPLEIDVNEAEIAYYDGRRRVRVSMRMWDDDPEFWRQRNGDFYINHRKTIPFTGEGWRYERITDPDIRRAVAKGIAMIVEGCIQAGIHDAATYFPDDRNPGVTSEIGETSSSCTITYKAKNKHYIPARPII